MEVEQQVGSDLDIDKQDQKVPLGFTARNDKPALVTFQQFFDLMRVVDSLNNLVNFVKQENFNADNIRYYFEDDLIETEDENGKKVKTLRQDFWNVKEEGGN
jgi:hypothetical protein